MFNKIKNVFKSFSSLGGGGSFSSYYTTNNNRGTIPPFNYNNALLAYSSWVAACIQINANEASSVPLRLYAKNTGNDVSKIYNTKKIDNLTKSYHNGKLSSRPSNTVIYKSNNMINDYVEITDHPVLQLLNNVNPYSNGFSFKNTRFTDLALYGNHYELIKKNSIGIPDSLYWLMSNKVKIKYNEDEILYYEYNNNGKITEYLPEEIIHYKGVRVSNEVYGMGQVEKAYQIIYLNLNQHISRNAFINNGSRPDYAVILKNANGKTTDADTMAMKRFKESITNDLTGPIKTGNFIPLRGDISIEPLSFQQNDIGERDRIVISEIAAIFGVPESMLMGTSNVAANTEAQARNWLKGIQTTLIMDEDELNQSLLPAYNIDPNESFLAYDNIIPEDQELQHRKMQLGADTRALTINQVLEYIGYDTVEDGDIFVSPKTDNNSKKEDEIKEEKGQKQMLNIEEAITKLEEEIFISNKKLDDNVFSAEKEIKPDFDVDELKNSIREIVDDKLDSINKDPIIINNNITLDDEIETIDTETDIISE